MKVCFIGNMQLFICHGLIASLAALTWTSQLMNLLLVLSSHVSLLYLHLGCFYTTWCLDFGHVIAYWYLNAETAVLFGQSSQRKVIPHPYKGG